MHPVQRAILFAPGRLTGLGCGGAAAEVVNVRVGGVVDTPRRRGGEDSDLALNADKKLAFLHTPFTIQAGK